MTRGFSLTRGKVMKQMTITSRLGELEKKIDATQWDMFKLKSACESLSQLEGLNARLVFFLSSGVFSSPGRGRGS